MKRKSYLIFSLLGIFFWILSTLYFVRSKDLIRPKNLAQTVQQYTIGQQKEVKALMQNKALVKRLWENSLTDLDNKVLLSKRFIIQVYANGKMTFWNNNTFVVEEQRFLPQLTAIKEHQNIFLYQSFGNAQYPNKRINIIIPIYVHYEIKNEYLRSQFFASPLIPTTSVVNFQSSPEGFDIKSIDHQTVFNITIPEKDIALAKPDSILILLVIAAFFSTILALQLISIQLSRSYSSLLGIGFIAIILILGQLVIYRFGLPFHLEYLDLFSPQIFAHNYFLSSLGHLLLHVLSIYWLFSLVLAQLLRADLNPFIGYKKPVLWGVLFIELLVSFLIFIYFKSLGKSLVFDSVISFDTNNFVATNEFTLIALVVIALLARVVYLKFQITSITIAKTIGGSWMHYSIIFLILLVMLGIKVFCVSYETSLETFSTSLFLLDLFGIFWFVLFLFLADSKKLSHLLPKSGLFSLIFISFFFSILLALYFKYYIDDKEVNNLRIAFAENLTRQQDEELELRFDSIAERIKEDSLLKDWLQFSDTISTNDIHRHFALFSSDLFYAKYAQDIFLFDANGKSMLANKRLSLDSLINLKNKSKPTICSSLFFRLEQSEQGAYLFFIPIKNKHQTELLGYLAINLKLKHNIVQSVYPKLLEDQSNLEKKNFDYSYAIYINEKLENQSGNYDFNFKLIPPLSYKNGFALQKKREYSELYYTATPNIVYVVVYKNKILTGVLTIFSFLFAIFLFISSVENWIAKLSAAWIKGTKIQSFYHRSMSTRIKYFVLGFTAISFFIVGISTIIFLTEKYQETNFYNIEKSTYNLSEAIVDFVQNNRQDDTIPFHLHDKEFVFFLSEIAKQQKIDINLFDDYGRIVFTTQEHIYKAKVFSQYMSPSAMHILGQKKLTNYLQNEKAGKLNFTASYIPLYSQRNRFLGYLNIPYFNTKEYLDNQITSLITTLINIYTILILVSSIITFIFINNLTHSLRLVADSMKNVNLKKNELINWDYNDEIGLLVEEYNKMVASVEKTARTLVLDERQNAWREMAQQVAHEIKNPLTPMKLNIQYLQQAINSNHPDIINLTKRVSSSIIEQIDNLNYIASEFSNFAKMPENKTERIDLKAMLENIVLLFAGNKSITINHILPEEPVIVFADKSQMLRIFTNIVQNAVESLSVEDENGFVTIELILNNEEKAVTIKVADNGSGIPDDVKDKIFDPYFTTKSSGTGLGLAMSKKIIELWGGNIRFESNHDKGTTFFLTVPLG